MPGTCTALSGADAIFYNITLVPYTFHFLTWLNIVFFWLEVWSTAILLVEIPWLCFFVLRKTPTYVFWNTVTGVFSGSSSTCWTNSFWVGRADSVGMGQNQKPPKTWGKKRGCLVHYIKLINKILYFSLSTSVGETPPRKPVPSGLRAARPKKAHPSFLASEFLKKMCLLSKNMGKWQ